MESLTIKVPWQTPRFGDQRCQNQPELSDLSDLGLSVSKQTRPFRPQCPKSVRSHPSSPSPPSHARTATSPRHDSHRPFAARYSPASIPEGECGAIMLGRLSGHPHLDPRHCYPVSPGCCLGLPQLRTSQQPRSDKAKRKPGNML